MKRVVTFSLSDNFIEKLVDYVVKHYLQKGRNISKIAFVFGGKRPSLFFARELAKKIKGGFVSPRFFSMDEFVAYLVAQEDIYSNLSDMNGCYLIYTLLRKNAHTLLKGRERFSQFLPWAREIISFIEQLDLDDVKNESLKTVQASTSIGYEVPETINMMLKDIITIRELYHTEMKSKKEYSRGYLYHLASEKSCEQLITEYDEFFFCNLFYLHKTEQKIIDRLLKHDKTRLFFQGDASNWSVLQAVEKHLSCSIQPEKNSESSGNISVFAGFDRHSQAGIASEILKDIREKNDTVIVLPNEENLIPVLSSISSVVGDFNISMGYPVKRSTLWSLFSSLFSAQETRKRDLYYTKDYLHALSHPFIKNVAIEGDFAISRVIIHKIEELLTGTIPSSISGSLFIKLEDIKEEEKLYHDVIDTLKTLGITINKKSINQCMEKLHEILFKSWEKIETFYEFSQSLENVLNILIDKSLMKYYPLNLSVFEKMFAIKEELMNALFCREHFEKSDMFKIFQNKLENEKISFKGSPLKGLQILGLFETRALNFKNALIMDLNEGVLPKERLFEPLIPREVMIMLGMKRPEEEIQRYLFKRLLGSAKNVYLVYEENKDVKKEKSRFLEDIIWQREKKHKRIDVVPITGVAFRSDLVGQHKEAKKTSEMIDFLKNHIYSATSLNTYIQCPLRFYYRYVLGIREKEELSEDAGGKDVGTFLHKLLEETFDIFRDKKPVINESFKKTFFAHFEKKFSAEFEKKIKSDSFVVREIMRHRLENFLNSEGERESSIIEIICLEEELKGTINADVGYFSLTAKIDRIDRVEDAGYLIIDYKSGSENVFPGKADALEALELSRTSIKQLVKSFQLPLYLYLVSKNKFGNEEKDNFELKAALYNLRNSEMKTYPAEKNNEDSQRALNACLNAMRFILGEIVNPGICFTADKDNKRICSFCPYGMMC